MKKTWSWILVRMIDSMLKEIGHLAMEVSNDEPREESGMGVTLECLAGVRDLHGFDVVGNICLRRGVHKKCSYRDSIMFAGIFFVFHW